MSTRSFSRSHNRERGNAWRPYMGDDGVNVLQSSVLRRGINVIRLAIGDAVGTWTAVERVDKKLS